MWSTDLRAGVFLPRGDDIDNLSAVALDQMSDAIAHSTLTLAMTTSAINGTAKGGSGGPVDLALKGNRALK